MKTEKLPNVPAHEPGDFYYSHLRLPYAAPTPGEELPHKPDPTIADLMDITTDDGTQLGFAILRTDNSLEIVDTITGEQVQIRLGEEAGETPSEGVREPLIKVALIESKAISVRLAEIIAHLQKQEHLAALRTFLGLDEQFKFLGTVLGAAARLPKK